MKCKNCRYYEKVTTDTGWCHKQPPLCDINNKIVGASHITVMEDDWCGEFVKTSTELNTSHTNEDCVTIPLYKLFKYSKGVDCFSEHFCGSHLIRFRLELTKNGWVIKGQEMFTEQELNDIKESNK